MTWPAPDNLHRTAKQLIDSGRAATPDDAMELLGCFVLQVDVGPKIDKNPADQAALLTIVNAARRAFLGGVVVRIEQDCQLTEAWAAGKCVSQTIRELGARIVHELSAQHATIVVGHPTTTTSGDVILRTTSLEWSGGVVEYDDCRLRGAGSTLAGVASGALAVSEAFQRYLGSPTAGRRDIGLSLWRPDLDWRIPEAAGPRIQWLPKQLWLLGLGHLGQAYAWCIGLLPYSSPSNVHIYLMDVDTVAKGNEATGLLIRGGDTGRRKTRVVAHRLEELKIQTSIVERYFDETFWPADHEPRIALTGFDHPSRRRQLGDDRFDRVIDAGLGTGPVEYLDMLVHTFPSHLAPAEAFGEVRQRSTTLPTAYSSEVARMVAEGSDEGDAACGMIEVAGISVGAAFVGATARSW